MRVLSRDNLLLHPNKGISLGQGLVGAWTMDEGAGSVVHDLSGRDNNGAVGDAVWAVGSEGRLLQTDGTDPIDCGVVLGSANAWVNHTQMAMMTWLRVDSGGATEEVWGRQRRGSSTNLWALSKVNNTLRGHVHTTAGYIDSEKYNWFTLNDGYDRPICIAVTWDGSYIRLYAVKRA